LNEHNFLFYKIWRSIFLSIAPFIDTARKTLQPQPDTVYHKGDMSSAHSTIVTGIGATTFSAYLKSRTA